MIKNNSQLLMMRIRGLSGPMISKHYKVPKLSKSIGNFFSGGSSPIAGDSITTETGDSLITESGDSIIIE